MTCQIEKDNQELKKRVKDLETQHKADIKKIKELLTNGDQKTIYHPVNPFSGPDTDK